MCQGQTGKVPCLSPGKSPFFQIWLYFLPVSPKNLALPPTLKLLFCKVQEWRSHQTRFYFDKLKFVVSESI